MFYLGLFFVSGASEAFGVRDLLYIFVSIVAIIISLLVPIYTTVKSGVFIDNPPGMPVNPCKYPFSLA